MPGMGGIGGGIGGGAAPECKSGPRGVEPRSFLGLRSGLNGTLAYAFSTALLAESKIGGCGCVGCCGGGGGVSALVCGGWGAGLFCWANSWSSGFGAGGGGVTIF